MTIRSALSLSLVALALTFAPEVRADSLPSCPAGTHMVMNPTPPGAMHHGGGYCEPDGASPNPVPTEAPIEAPSRPEAPVGTPPAETPTATPEAALPTAPASTESVPATPASTEAPASSGMCSVGSGRSASLVALVSIALALLFTRRVR